MLITDTSTGVDAIQATQSLLVPPTALTGTTRMRVKKIFGKIRYMNYNGLKNKFDVEAYAKKWLS